MRKLIKQADVRERMDAFERGEISYSRAVELLNEDANRNLISILECAVCGVNSDAGSQVFLCEKCGQEHPIK
jgi:hypothetical protein